MTSASASTHLVQFYDEDHVLVESVARFLGAGLGAGESAVAIALPTHHAGFEKVLADSGFDLEKARSAGRYVALDAADTLSRILKNGRPDPEAFAGVIGGCIQRAAAGGARPVRLYGEMVALLWEREDPETAIRLEELWNELGRQMPFALLCAYPIGRLEGEAGGHSLLRI